MTAIIAVKEKVIITWRIRFACKQLDPEGAIMILMYTFKFGLGKDLLNILQDLELKAKSGDDLLQECEKTVEGI